MTKSLSTPSQLAARAERPVPSTKGQGAPLHKRPRVFVAASLLVVGLTASACGSGDSEDSSAGASSSVKTSAPSSAVAPSPSTAPAPAPAPPETVATTFTMPDLVGMDLQSAQNLVQTFGPFVSLSHDLLGNRNQLLDANWRVCDQNIPAGQQVSGDAEGLIDVGVVKLEEACP